MRVECMGRTLAHDGRTLSEPLPRFSFDGYTMMELAGGIGKMDVDAIETRCGSRHPTDSLCARIVEFPDLVPKSYATVTHGCPVCRCVE